MATLSKKDITTVTFNSVPLLAYTDTIGPFKDAVELHTYQPTGSVSDKTISTGHVTNDPVTWTGPYDDVAAGPNATFVKGTDATLLVTLVSGKTITGKYIVNDRELVLGNPDMLTVVLTPSNSDGNGVVWTIS